jgi:UDP-N-acetylglucosamine pyrophosphorylase
MNHTDCFPEFAQKMRARGLNEAAIRAFEFSYRNLVAGKTGLIAEATIEPARELPRLEAIGAQQAVAPALLSQTVVVKLNGGLGTSMGLEQAKSLLRIKGDLSFLDFIARQILHLRQRTGLPLRFLLMNSFSTSEDTKAFLRRYPELGDPEALELMQNAVPKVDAATFKPAVWPADPELEWCPPGHGDLYPSLLGSGWLDRLLEHGVKFMFVSNSDNLGASLDLHLLSYFAASNKPFLMEVAERTPSDRKGGHLAVTSGTFLLRESAQCPEADQAAFQDIQRHRFFNTNNLWVRLDRLRQLLDRNGGFVPLPMIKNAKTVDPRNKKSTPVIQLETAMGAAIECFADSGAVVVPRTRFAPVKTTSDLLALRSDAYEVTADFRPVLAACCGGVPPTIDLDGEHYKLVDQLDARLTQGTPSLRGCRELTVRGPVTFQAGTEFRGNVTVQAPPGTPRVLPPGVYSDCVVEV